MRRLTRVVPPAEATAAVLTLGFEERRRSRWRARLDGGDEVAIVLPSGIVLRDGDCLAGEPGDDFVVVVRAAAESLSVGRTSDPHLLARAAYHLGNRHIPLQIAPGYVAYQHDHVLDRMVRDLGLEVSVEPRPFEPEAGGYRHEGNHHESSGHGHAHGHNHERGDAHDHEHPQPPSGRPGRAQR